MKNSALMTTNPLDSNPPLSSMLEETKLTCYCIFFSEVCVVNHRNFMRINYPFEFLARQNTKLKKAIACRELVKQ